MDPDKRMLMPTPDNNKYDKQRQKHTKDILRRCPIINCGTVRTSEESMMQHILAVHPLIETEWRCSKCEEEIFESKLSVRAHVRVCFRAGTLRSRPVYRKAWVWDVRHRKIYRTEHPAEYLTWEGDLAMSTHEARYKKELGEMRKQKVIPETKEMLRLPRTDKT